MNLTEGSEGSADRAVPEAHLEVKKKAEGFVLRDHFRKNRKICTVLEDKSAV